MTNDLHFWGVRESHIPTHTHVSLRALFFYVCIYIYTHLKEKTQKKNETAVILYIIYYFDDDALFSIYVATIHLY